MTRLMASFVGCVILVLSTYRGSAVGTIVIGPDKAISYGLAISNVSQDLADMDALSRCGSACIVALRFVHTCAAYAADLTPGSSASGWSASRSLVEAEDLAILQCQRRAGKYCIALAWGCDR